MLYSCDSREELCGRIVDLEEFARHAAECVCRLNDTSEDGGCVFCPYQSIDCDCDFNKRLSKMGVM